MVKLLALAIMTAAAMQGGFGSDAPIHLTSRAVEGGMRFEVIGAPPSPYEATFLLEVSSSGNQSRHQGSARLEGGERAILSTVTLGLSAQSRWRARLRVEPSGGTAYEQVIESSRG